MHVLIHMHTLSPQRILPYSLHLLLKEGHLACGELRCLLVRYLPGMLGAFKVGRTLGRMDQLIELEHARG